MSQVFYAHICVYLRIANLEYYLRISCVLFGDLLNKFAILNKGRYGVCGMPPFAETVYYLIVDSAATASACVYLVTGYLCSATFCVLVYEIKQTWNQLPAILIHIFDWMWNRRCYVYVLQNSFRYDYNNILVHRISVFLFVISVSFFYLTVTLFFNYIFAKRPVKYR